MAFHVLVYAHMRLTVLVIENACTELDDIASVMSQNLFNCIGGPQRRQSESPRAVKTLCSCVHRSSFTPNLPPASAPLAFFAARSAFLSGGAVQHSGTFP